MSKHTNAAAHQNATKAAKWFEDDYGMALMNVGDIRRAMVEADARVRRLRAAVLANGEYAEVLRRELFQRVGSAYQTEHVRSLRDRADAANALCHQHGDLTDAALYWSETEGQR